MGLPRPACFLPSRDGLAFTNSWPPAPGLSVPTPFGSIGIGNAAAGLCGGMVFAALDYWCLGLAAPVSRPAAGTPLYRYIVRRLIDSWHLPAGVARYYQWMNLPDGDSPVRLRGHRLGTVHGVSWRTVAQQWPRVRASLDRGRPAVLGLVTVASAWPGLLGRNHQVLAYGYELSGSIVTVAVYDPNTGPDDAVRIVFDSAAPAKPTAFEHNIAIGWPVRGFFLTGYSPTVPPASGPPASAPAGRAAG
jgi:hypothetical protein